MGNRRRSALLFLSCTIRFFSSDSFLFLTYHHFVLFFPHGLAFCWVSPLLSLSITILLSFAFPLLVIMIFLVFPSFRSLIIILLRFSFHLPPCLLILLTIATFLYMIYCWFVSTCCCFHYLAFTSSSFCALFSSSISLLSLSRCFLSSLSNLLFFHYFFSLHSFHVPYLVMPHFFFPSHAFAFLRLA